MHTITWDNIPIELNTALSFTCPNSIQLNAPLQFCIDTSFDFEWRLRDAPTILGSDTVFEPYYDIYGLAPDTEYEWRVKYTAAVEWTEWVLFRTKAEADLHLEDSVSLWDSHNIYVGDAALLNHSIIDGVMFREGLGTGAYGSNGSNDFIMNDGAAGFVIVDNVYIYDKFSRNFEGSPNNMKATKVDDNTVRLLWEIRK